jgi:hypothetical protein
LFNFSIVEQRERLRRIRTAIYALAPRAGEAFQSSIDEAGEESTGYNKGAAAPVGKDFTAAALEGAHSVLGDGGGGDGF